MRVKIIGGNVLARKYGTLNVTRLSSLVNQICELQNQSMVVIAFQRDADAPCVYVNTPASFTYGTQFGLGVEIGISTQKFHVRGPMALEEMMTYKRLIFGKGQTRRV